tara:strand:- start:327 stop:575 length:249 start_codon:yes stop_codon:yes gene_type:complete
MLQRLNLAVGAHSIQAKTPKSALVGHRKYPDATRMPHNGLGNIEALRCSFTRDISILQKLSFATSGCGSLHMAEIYTILEGP